ncbi:hypothetical protein N6L27_11945 [Leisingera sp. SS27]|uniref:hypothetical protein n=1 Tax=Leisingera sp. SS27 TaxID=2979462 RepID=UPI0023306FC1|nr:hypothetical protein [Leisingera sp. SS27]MDC0658713.1 hypothetical protein [Leisingera sp. SS27]
MPADRDLKKHQLNTPKKEQTCSRFQEILEFWHKLEFSTPFDLTKRVENPGQKKVFWLHPEDLEATLRIAAAFRPPEGNRISSIHLFAGVFDIADLSEVAREICASTADGNGFDNDERGLPEGRTCFARFGLSEDFRINFEDVEISTLPWAMGRNLTVGVDTLSLSAFQADLKRLKDTFFMLRRLHSDEPAGPVTSVEIL